MVDSICGGAFMEKTLDEIYNLYENLSENSRDQVSFELYDKDKKREIYELHHDDDSKLRNEKKESSFHHNAIILDQLPMKCKDPGKPLISCKIGGITFDNALLDLGAGVNFLPTAIAEHFRIGELKPASTILQVVDRSTRKPKGILEDVIVKKIRIFGYLEVFQNKYINYNSIKIPKIAIIFQVNHRDVI
ncbi:unnamed protein product [Spirodela intermedia]|uniref:Uncharacterized protein n=1 Tax=Spirodela intermedia TaxID=51605 RepID=A0A7I8LLU0_SPIIN|nr:unnamed protein product [Spirodela intermedia]